MGPSDTVHPILVWKYLINVSPATESYEVHINASTGEVVNKIPLAYDCNGGSSTTIWNGARTIFTQLNAGSYRTLGDCNSAQVHTMNGNGNDNSNGKEVNLVQKTYGITCNAKVFRTKESKKEYDLEIGISAFGMTCCPCAQQMNKEFSMDALKNSKDLNLTEEQIEKILSIVPIASHNQRALAMIILKTK